MSTFSSNSNPPNPIIHIAAVKYDPSATEDERKAFEHDILSQKDLCCRDGVPYLLSVKWLPHSPFPTSSSMDAVFHVEFANEEDVGYHLEEDPVHAEVMERHVGKTIVDMEIWDLSAS